MQTASEAVRMMYHRNVGGIGLQAILPTMLVGALILGCGSAVEGNSGSEFSGLEGSEQVMDTQQLASHIDVSWQTFVDLLTRVQDDERQGICVDDAVEILESARSMLRTAETLLGAGSYETASGYANDGRAALIQADSKLDELEKDFEKDEQTAYVLLIVLSVISIPLVFWLARQMLGYYKRLVRKSFLDMEIQYEDNEIEGKPQ